MKNRKPYIAVLTLAVLVLSLGGCGKSKQQNYDSARNLYFYGQYSEARKAFKNLGGLIPGQRCYGHGL